MYARGVETAARTNSPVFGAARRRKRSSLLLAGASIVVAALVPALVADAGPPALAAVLALEQVLLGWAWVRVLAASSVTFVIVLVAALAADATALITDSDEIGGSAGVVGIAVVAVILGQLWRRRAGAGVVTRDRPSTPGGAVVGSAYEASHGASSGQQTRITVDMAAGLSGVVVVTLLTSYLDVVGMRTPTGRAVGATVVAAGLLGAGAAVLFARLCAAARARPVVARLAGFVVGAATGSVFGGLAGGIDAADGTVIAAVAAAAAVVTDLAVARGAAEFRGGDRPSTLPLVSILPLATAAAFVYAIGHLLVG